MAFILYIADLSDATLATKAVDLNGAETSSFKLFEVDESSFDPGSPDMESVVLAEEGVDDDVQAGQRLPRVEMSFNLRIVPTTSFERIRAAIRDLNRELRAGGTIVYRPSQEVETLYLDYHPSPLSRAFRGQERGMFKILTLLQDPDGMPVHIARRPTYRAAIARASVNLAGNGMLLEDPDDNGVPNGWAWSSNASITSRIVWTQPSYAPVVATSGSRDLTRNYAVTVGQAYSVGVDIASDLGADGTGLPSASALIQWLDGSAAVISESGGGGGPVGGGGSGGGSAQSGRPWSDEIQWGRATTTGVAPAGAVSANVGLRIANGNATAIQYFIRRAQFQTGATATDFRSSPETVVQGADQTFGNRIWVSNRGNAPAPTQWRIAPDGSSAMAGVWIARRSGYRNSAEFAAMHSGARIKDVTLAADTTQQTDLGVAAARTVFADSVMRQHWRDPHVPIDPTSIQGRYKIIVALRGDLAHTYLAQIRYGFGNLVELPLTATPDPIPLDWTQPTTNHHVLLDMGTITVPPSAQGLYIEGWAQQTDAAGAALNWIGYWLLPADEQISFVTLPGAFKPSQVGTQKWLGVDMQTPPATPPGAGTTAGRKDKTACILDDTTDACAITPPAGIVLSAVPHTVTVEGTMYNPDSLANKKGEFRIHNVTTNTLVAKMDIRGVKGVTYPPLTLSAKFTPVAGNAYLYWVARTGGTGTIRVVDIVDTYVPPVSGVTSQTIALDGDTRQAYVIEAGQRKSNLTIAPPFPTLEPDTNLFMVLPGENAANGYDTVDARGPLMKYDRARSVSVSVDLVPTFT